VLLLLLQIMTTATILFMLPLPLPLLLLLLLLLLHPVHTTQFDTLDQNQRAGSSDESPLQVASSVIADIISQLFASSHGNHFAAIDTSDSAADAADDCRVPSSDSLLAGEFDALLSASDRR
jgi:nitrogen fixation-related uncharacterized protein